VNVRFLEAARNDLRDAIRFYNEQRPGLGRELRDEINATIERITRLPEAWRPLSKNTRRCRTHRFPYGVIYQLRSDEILIIAIAHLHRELGYWDDRI
jgi:plasmid stabilization system protein ParE